MEGLGQVQKYRLLNLIARGGMGEVFLARQEGPAGFSKTVVLKRILEHLSSDESFVEMFLNEARLAAFLSHPNIVQIFELGLEEGSYFIAMEFVHGRSLRAIRKKLSSMGQVLRPAFAAKICLQALRGLHYAHALHDQDGKPLEIVHRDVSPENILVGFNGVVKLVDFGISKAANTISTTRVGALKGKFHYMAPEQLTASKLDARADLYAMGVVLYEVLTGIRPFTAANDPMLFDAILNGPLRPPVELQPDLPPVLNDIVIKALSRPPEERFPTADAMADALQQYLESTAEKVSDGDIAALLKELFGSEAAYNPDVLPTPRPNTQSSRRSSSISPAVISRQNNSFASGGSLGPGRSNPSSALAIRPVPTNGFSGAPLRKASQASPTVIEEHIDILETTARASLKALLRKRRVVIAAAVLLLLLGGGFLAMLLGRSDQEPTVASAPKGEVTSPVPTAPSPPGPVAAVPSPASAVPGKPVPTKAQLDDETLRTYLDTIEKLAVQDRYSAAMDLLHKARRINTSDAQLNIRLAELNDTVEKKALLARGKTLFEGGDLKAAATAAKELVSRDPQNPEALHLMQAVNDKLQAKAREAATLAAATAKRNVRPTQSQKRKRQSGKTLLVSSNPLVTGATSSDKDQDSSDSSPTDEVNPPAESTSPPTPNVATSATSASRSPSPPPATVATTAAAAETSSSPNGSPKESKAPPTAVALRAPQATSSAPETRRAPRLPVSFRARSSKDILKVFQFIEDEAINTGGVSSRIARNVTMPLAEELTSNVIAAQGIELYPRSIYNIIVSHGTRGEPKSELGEILRRAYLQGTLQQEAAK